MTDPLERPKRFAFGLEAKYGSRACKQLGDGQRIFYLDGCDGTTLAVQDCQGRPFKVAVKDIVLRKVYGPDGKERKYEIVEETGHLIVFLEKHANGDDIWEDICAWTRFDRTERVEGVARKTKKAERPAFLE